MSPSFKDAAVAGIVASLAYTAVAQPLVVALYGAESFLVPFRQIAAVAVGPSALAPTYDAASAVTIGTGVHLIVGIMYAAVFCVIVRGISLSGSARNIALGMSFGLAIYALNLFVIFPRWFPWFLENNPFLQALLHAFPFGAVLGWWLSPRPLARVARLI